MKKHVLLLTMALLVLCSFTGCRRKNFQRIGVLMFDESLDNKRAYQGFLEGLRREGYENEENIIIQYHTAGGEISACVQIAQEYIRERVDVILTVGEKAAQVVSNLSSKIPVIATAVNDFELAKLVESNAFPETNISGVSDRSLCEEQMNLIKQYVPNITRIAIVYEMNNEYSMLQSALAKSRCEQLGMSYIDFPIKTPDDIDVSLRRLKGVVNALFIPSDRMIEDNFRKIETFSFDNNVPVFSCNGEMLPRGAFATLSVNYFDLGVQTSSMVIDVLNGKNPEQMPVQFQKKGDLHFNQKAAATFGITIPEE